MLYRIQSYKNTGTVSLRGSRRRPASGLRRKTKALAMAEVVHVEGRRRTRSLGTLTAVLDLDSDDDYCESVYSAKTPANFDLTRDVLDLTSDDSPPPASFPAGPVRSVPSAIDLTGDDDVSSPISEASPCARCNNRDANPGFALCQQCFDVDRRRMQLCTMCGVSPRNLNFDLCGSCYVVVRAARYGHGRGHRSALAPVSHAPLSSQAHVGGGLSSAASGRGIATPAEDASYEELLALDANIVSQGLGARELRSLGTRHFLGSQDALGRNGEASCAICMCDYEEGESLSLLPCSHTFHQECVSRWLCSKPHCPVCMRDVREDLRM